MNIEGREEGDIIILRVGGRMDLDEIPRLDAAVQACLEKGARKIILNLLDITDCSSTGISRLVNLHKYLEQRKGRMVIAEAAPVVEYVLELARLDDIFDQYRTEAAAIESFSDDPPDEEIPGVQ